MTEHDDDAMICGLCLAGNLGQYDDFYNEASPERFVAGYHYVVVD